MSRGVDNPCCAPCPAWLFEYKCAFLFFGELFCCACDERRNALRVMVRCQRPRVVGDLASGVRIGVGGTCRSRSDLKTRCANSWRYGFFSTRRRNARCDDHLKSQHVCATWACSRSGAPRRIACVVEWSTPTRPQTIGTHASYLTGAYPVQPSEVVCQFV